MKKQLEKRLEQLKSEFEKGKHRLEELDKEENDVRNTLLRIGGAIQVLEEELQKSPSENGKANKVDEEALQTNQQ